MSSNTASEEITTTATTFEYKYKCDNCERIGTALELFRCSRCKDRFYCNRKCQKKDWKAGHKYSCYERDDESSDDSSDDDDLPKYSKIDEDNRRLEEMDCTCKDVELVMNQTGCLRQVAVDSLLDNEGDLVNAIMTILDNPCRR